MAKICYRFFTFIRVADCACDISNCDSEQEDLVAIHFEETIGGVADKNDKISEVKRFGMIWKDYDLQETNEEQRKETDRLVELLFKKC